MWHMLIQQLCTKINLANLKTEVDKLDIDKLTPVPNDLGKLSNVVKHDAVKKTEYDKLVTKVDKIDTARFALKNTYDTDKSDLEKKISDADKKIPDTSKLTKKTDLNAKITEIESKIPSISGLATNSVKNVVKKTGHDTKISKIEKKLTDQNYDKYITTTEFNNLFTANLVRKTDFDTKLIRFNKKLTQIKQNIYLLKMN